MEKPLISIIIACYNAEDYLDRCIESVLNQTLGQDKMEIILVDDRSSDSTPEIIRRYETEYDCIRAIYNKENLRQGGSQNRALEIAGGRYIGFIDNDDWIEPDMYRDMIEKAKAHQCDLVNILNIRSSKPGFLQPEDIPSGREDTIINISDDVKRAEIIAGGAVKIGTWNCIFEKSVIDEHNIHFPDHLIYEDIYWGGLCHLYFKKIYQMEKYYYHYFVRDDSTVLIKDNDIHMDFFEMQDLLWKEYTSRYAFERYKEALEFDYLMNYYIIGMKILALRFSRFPSERFYMMQEDINKKIPGWHDNRYIKTNTTEFQRLQFDILNSKINEEELEQFAKLTRQYYGG